MEENNTIVDLTEMDDFACTVIDLTVSLESCAVSEQTYWYGGALCKDLTDWQKQVMHETQSQLNKRYTAYVEMKRQKRLAELKPDRCAHIIRYKFGTGYVMKHG